MFRSFCMMSPEERRNRRISYQTPVGGMLLGENRVLNMFSSNLSRGGMFVDMANVPTIGSELVCNLATAGGRSAIQVRGRVTWHRGNSGVGIQFVDLSDDEASELETIVGEGIAIPQGEQSEAVYELVELESADTAKTVVEDAFDDMQIDVSMDEMEALPSLDAAIELPAAPPVPKYDDIEDPAFTKGGGAVRAQMVPEETDKIHATNREPRSWLLAGVVGAAGVVAIGMAGLGLFSSDATPNNSGVAAEEARAGERERVLALVEGDGHSKRQQDLAIGRIRAAAQSDSAADESMDELPVGGPVFEVGEATKTPIKKVTPKLAPPAPKKAARAKPTLVKRQVLGGVVVRDSSDAVLVRVPLTGSVENQKHYVMNEPAAFAVNLPYAQPKKGFFDSLEPESDNVRLIWVRERLGGLHLRLFFSDTRPECEVETTKQELVVRCRY